MSVQPPENPVKTIMRLIENKIRVVKDNAAVASIKVTMEDFDRELLKTDYDAQITVGLDPVQGVQDQKLNMAGTLRRRVAWLRVCGFSMNRADPTADSGETMRDKITEQIEAIIRENRTNPFTTIYNFYSLGYPYGYPHVASDAAGAADLAPTNTAWSELSAVNYQKIWSVDANLHSKSNAAAGGVSLMLFKFKIGANEPSVKSIVLRWDGYGTAQGGDGATIKVWDHVAGAWAQAVTGTASAKETLTITLASAWTNYIDANGFLYLLAETTNPEAGGTPAVLYCDFVQCTIQVKGLTNCDVVVGDGAGGTKTLHFTNGKYTGET